MKVISDNWYNFEAINFFCTNVTFGDSIYRSAGLIDSCSGYSCLRRVTVVALVITRGRARIGWAPSDDSVSEAGS